MKALLNYFVDLCLLRVSPQGLPGSSALYWLLLLLNLLVGMLLIVDRLGALDKALAAAVFDLLLMLSWLRLLLSFKGRKGRFLQSATAVLGSGVLLGLLVLPLQVAVAADHGSLYAEMAAIVLFVILIWSQVVTAHILRHALDVGLGLAFGLALSYALLATLLFGVFFPEGNS